MWKIKTEAKKRKYKLRQDIVFLKEKYFIYWLVYHVNFNKIKIRRYYEL